MSKSLIEIEDHTKNDNFAIVAASSANKIEAVRDLLKNKTVNPAARKGQALISASNQGFIEVVKVLLEDQRVDPTISDNMALESARRSEQWDIVDLLLKNTGVYFLDMAKHSEWEELMKLLIPAGDLLSVSCLARSFKYFLNLKECIKQMGETNNDDGILRKFCGKLNISVERADENTNYLIGQILFITDQMGYGVEYNNHILELCIKERNEKDWNILFKDFHELKKGILGNKTVLKQELSNYLEKEILPHIMDYTSREFEFRRVYEYKSEGKYKNELLEKFDEFSNHFIYESTAEIFFEKLFPESHKGSFARRWIAQIEKDMPSVELIAMNGQKEQLTVKKKGGEVELRRENSMDNLLNQSCAARG